MNEKSNPALDEVRQLLKATKITVPDFPEPGILFEDLTPVLTRHFARLVEVWAARYSGWSVDAVVAPESRGFIFGAPLATLLGCAFVPVRKPGKLPRPVHRVSYSMEYGSGPQELQMHRDALAPGARTLIVDDVLATGGTAQACCELVKMSGAQVLESAFVIEIQKLAGRSKIPSECFAFLSL